MRALILVLAVMSFPAFAKQQHRAVDNVGAMPTLITYDHLMSLNAKRKDKYLHTIALAMADFEYISRRVFSKRHAGIPTEGSSAVAQWFADLALPSALAADAQTATTSSDCTAAGGTLTAYEGTYTCLLWGINGSPNPIPSETSAAFDSDTPTLASSIGLPSAQAAAAAADPTAPKMDPAAVEEIAKRCNFDPKVLKSARTEYAAGQMHSQNCMIGAMPSSYRNRSMPEEGGCSTVADWNEQKGLCHTPQTLCNPALFCGADGKVLCKNITQDTAKNCYESSTKNLSTNHCATVTAEDWEKLKKSFDDLCDTKSARVLFCFECSKLKSMVVAANQAAGPAPPGSPPPPDEGGATHTGPGH